MVEGISTPLDDHEIRSMTMYSGDDHEIRSMTMYSVR